MQENHLAGVVINGGNLKIKFAAELPTNLTVVAIADQVFLQTNNTLIANLLLNLPPWTYQQILSISFTFTSNPSSNALIMYAYLELVTVFSAFSKQLVVPELWRYLQCWIGPLF